MATVDITITNDLGQSARITSAFTFIGAPVIESLEPTSGPASGGTVVTIRGKHFRPGDTVLFGTTPATGVTVAADGLSLTCVTPAVAA